MFTTMKTKHILFLLTFFIISNITVYIFTEINTKSKIDLVLEENKNTLFTHYNILLESHKHISYAIYKSILRNTDAKELLEKSYKMPLSVQAKNRKKLYEELIDQYETAKQQGILQIQFVFKDNVSFLRVHKPSKFGDNLTDIRKDFKLVNKTQKPIRGFTQGRTSHGFRNTFPIFNNQNEHIGAVEISFTSESFQWYLNYISHIHSHFLIKKDMFYSKAWHRNDMLLKYIQSSENTNYMLNLGTIHTREVCLIENMKKMQSVKDKVYENMKRGEPFCVYVLWKNKVEVISFLSIKNLENRSVAWIVAYKDSPIIHEALNMKDIIRVLSFIISLVITYFFVLQIKAKQQLTEKNQLIQKEQNLVDDILNSTDNIMVVTDFKDIKYSNQKFKNLISIENSKQLNQFIKHNVLDLFVKNDGYLHSDLLNENENFPDLILRTTPENRLVGILDLNNLLKIFTISISKLKNNGEYLVTLTDITKMREQYKRTELKAYTDSLTAVYNRNKFDEVFNDEIRYVARYNHPFCLAIIDIDNFKIFNDKYGHLIGDEVLIQMATSINNNLRITDTFARWGGEEFVILFKNTAINEAISVANKLRNIISEDKHPLAGNITISFGISQYINEDDMDSMFKRCDDALYLAKENGRNRVETK